MKTPIVLDNKISVDSLKIRIPIELVEIKNNLISDTKLVLSELTGEIERVIKDNYLLFDGVELVKEKIPNSEYKTGIKTRFCLGSFHNKNKVQEYLYIQVNSKVLGVKYFEGLTLNNIKFVYDFLISLGVSYFSYDDFLHKSECTDIDFKRDIVCSDSKSLFSYLISIAKQNNKVDRGYLPHNKKDNQGLQFGKRENTDCIKSPFLKFYDKCIEFINKSVVFSGRYFSKSDLKNIVRVEATVKNKKHLNNLGVYNNSLYSILNLSSEDKEKIIKNHYDKHLFSVDKVKCHNKEMKGLAPMDAFICGVIINQVNKGIPFSESLHSGLAMIDCKTSKSRIKKKITNLYEKHILKNGLDNNTDSLSNALEDLGLFGVA